VAAAHGGVAKYSEEYCAAINNEKLFRQIYLDSYRRQLAERDLDAAVEFFRTEPGQRFVNSTMGGGRSHARGAGCGAGRRPTRDAVSTRKSRCGSRDFSRDKRLREEMRYASGRTMNPDRRRI